MSHVLEHVRDRLDARGGARAARTGGLLRVEVPNLAGLSARAKNLQSRLGLKRHPWKHYSTGHHFWFFHAPHPRADGPRPRASSACCCGRRRAVGRAGAGRRFVNAVYQRFLWGGHVVAFAWRPGP